MRLKAAHQSVYMKIGQNNHVRAAQFDVPLYSIMGRYARGAGQGEMPHILYAISPARKYQSASDAGFSLYKKCSRHADIYAYSEHLNFTLFIASAGYVLCCPV